MSKQELPAGAGPVDGRVRPVAEARRLAEWMCARRGLGDEYRQSAEILFAFTALEIERNALRDEVAALRKERVDNLLASADIDIIAEHSGKTKDREWHSVGCWLRPGEVLAHTSKPNA